MIFELGPILDESGQPCKDLREEHPRMTEQQTEIFKEEVSSTCTKN